MRVSTLWSFQKYVRCAFSLQCSRRTTQISTRSQRAPKLGQERQRKSTIVNLNGRSARPRPSSAACSLSASRHRALKKEETARRPSYFKLQVHKRKPMEGQLSSDNCRIRQGLLVGISSSPWIRKALRGPRGSYLSLPGNNRHTRADWCSFSSSAPPPLRLLTGHDHRTYLLSFSSCSSPRASF